MHLLSMVADRLWLVSDGTVKPYDDDLESYRKMLLTPSKPVSKNAKPKEAPKPKRASLDEILALRSEVRKAEARVEKLNEMRDKLAKKLADPALYEDGKIGELEVWNKKYAEVMGALERAETLWVAAESKLEKASA
jgi:ATP-binding cassette subfamily F protein 3